MWEKHHEETFVYRIFGGRGSSGGFSSRHLGGHTIYSQRIGSAGQFGPVRLAFDTGIYSIAFPVKDPEHIGIGYIVEPEPFHRTWSPMTDFVMHDHMYVAPGVPDPRRANITYRFDAPAKISEVLIVQHTNGIAQVEGFIGYDEKDLKSIGFANSTLGTNLPLRENTFAEGYRDVFKFERVGERKVFRVVITKTPLPNGYAVYRVYPRNSDHRPYDVLRSD